MSLLAFGELSESPSEPASLAELAESQQISELVPVESLLVGTDPWRAILVARHQTMEPLRRPEQTDLKPLVEQPE